MRRQFEAGKPRCPASPVSCVSWARMWRAAAFLAVLLCPSVAAAHATIVRTNPEQGGSAPAALGKVEVWYNEGIGKELVALAVLNSSGSRVDKRDAAIDGADPSHVSVSVEALTPGEYTVRYRAVSADGHIVSGAFNFVVKAP